MGLRCKAGDLAVVVGSMAHRNGAVYKVERLAGRSEVVVRANGREVLWIDPEPADPGWVVHQDGAPFDWCGDVMVLAVCSDSTLVPLRDNEGEDETLQWAGLPQQTKQPVPA